jgi:hypothetical protein
MAGQQNFFWNSSAWQVVSRRKIHPPQQFGEAWVGAQRVEDGIHFDLRHAMVGARCQGQRQVL